MRRFEYFICVGLLFVLQVSKNAAYSRRYSKGRGHGGYTKYVQQVPKVAVGPSLAAASVGIAQAIAPAVATSVQAVADVSIAAIENAGSRGPPGVRSPLDASGNDFNQVPSTYYVYNDQRLNTEYNKGREAIKESPQNSERGLIHVTFVQEAPSHQTGTITRPEYYQSNLMRGEDSGRHVQNSPAVQPSGTVTRPQYYQSNLMRGEESGRLVQNSPAVQPSGTVTRPEYYQSNLMRGEESSRLVQNSPAVQPSGTVTRPEYYQSNLMRGEESSRLVQNSPAVQPSGTVTRPEYYQSNLMRGEESSRLVQNSPAVQPSGTVTRPEYYQSNLMRGEESGRHVQNSPAVQPSGTVTRPEYYQSNLMRGEESSRLVQNSPAVQPSGTVTRPEYYQSNLMRGEESGRHVQNSPAVQPSGTVTRPEYYQSNLMRGEESSRLVQNSPAVQRVTTIHETIYNQGTNEQLSSGRFQDSSRNVPISATHVASTRTTPISRETQHFSGVREGSQLNTGRAHVNNVELQNNLTSGSNASVGAAKTIIKENDHTTQLNTGQMQGTFENKQSTPPSGIILTITTTSKVPATSYNHTTVHNLNSGISVKESTEGQNNNSESELELIRDDKNSTRSPTTNSQSSSRRSANNRRRRQRTSRRGSRKGSQTSSRIKESSAVSSSRIVAGSNTTTQNNDVGSQIEIIREIQNSTNVSKTNTQSSSGRRQNIRAKSNQRISEQTTSTKGAQTSTIAEETNIKENHQATHLNTGQTEGTLENKQSTAPSGIIITITTSSTAPVTSNNQTVHNLNSGIITKETAERKNNNSESELKTILENKNSTGSPTIIQSSSGRRQNHRAKSNRRNSNRRMSTKGSQTVPKSDESGTNSSSRSASSEHSDMGLEIVSIGVSQNSTDLSETSSGSQNSTDLPETSRGGSISGRRPNNRTRINERNSNRRMSTKGSQTLPKSNEIGTNSSSRSASSEHSDMGLEIVSIGVSRNSTDLPETSRGGSISGRRPNNRTRINERNSGRGPSTIESQTLPKSDESGTNSSSRSASIEHNDMGLEIVSIGVSQNSTDLSETSSGSRNSTDLPETSRGGSISGRRPNNRTRINERNSNRRMSTKGSQTLPKSNESGTNSSSRSASSEHSDMGLEIVSIGVSRNSTDLPETSRGGSISRRRPNNRTRINERNSNRRMSTIESQTLPKSNESGTNSSSRSASSEHSDMGLEIVSIGVSRNSTDLPETSRGGSISRRRPNNRTRINERNSNRRMSTIESQTLPKSDKIGTNSSSRSASSEHSDMGLEIVSIGVSRNSTDLPETSRGVSISGRRPNNRTRINERNSNRRMSTKSQITLENQENNNSSSGTVVEGRFNRRRSFESEPARHSQNSTGIPGAVVRSLAQISSFYDLQSGSNETRDNSIESDQSDFEIQSEISQELGAQKDMEIFTSDEKDTTALISPLRIDEGNRSVQNDNTKVTTDTDEIPKSLMDQPVSMSSV